MSQLLMDMSSEALTSLAEDFLVSLTPLQEAVKRLVMSVICGERSFALWGKRNPDGSWERTSQDSLALNLDDSSGEWSMTWPRWGTAWDGRCMEHPTPERFTAAIESLSLGTPTSRDWKGAGRPGQLPTQMLPTPIANDAKDYHAAKPEIVNTREQQKNRGGGCANLAERMAAQMLPTPAASQMGKPVRPLAPSEVDGSHGTMLVGAIGQAIGESGESAQRLGLNPEFVEVMMNFPVGWTELTD